MTCWNGCAGLLSVTAAAHTTKCWCISSAAWPRTRARRRAMAARKRGSGNAYEYATAAGKRWRVKGMVSLPDGTTKEINKRGFMTKKEAADWLKAAQVDGQRGNFVEPSKQKLGDYG